MQKGKKTDLVLIGTVHGDPKGAYRLRRLLSDEAPRELAVEISPFGLYYRVRFGKRLKRLLMRRLRRLEKSEGRSLLRVATPLAEKINLPFEYTVACRYSRETGCGLHLIDLSGPSRMFIEENWPEMLSLDNLRRLCRYTAEAPHPDTEATYSLAERLLNEKDPVLLRHFVSSLDACFAEREAHLAESLTSLCNKARERKVAYVGGWEHLLHPTGLGTLCDRLSELRPRRLLLNQNDRF